jgi:hypothetical protein
VTKVESLIKRKLEIYHYLKDKLTDFKKSLKEEEEVHHQTVAKGFAFNKKR